LGNLAYIKTRLPVEFQQLRKDLEEISEKRFNGTLVFSPWAVGDGWSITFLGYNRHISAYLESPHEIHIAHSAGDLLWWIDFVITNDLALKYDGEISDDAVGETWKGEPGKYPTFSNVLDLMYDHEAFGGSEHARTGCQQLRAASLEHLNEVLVTEVKDKLGKLIGE